MHIGTLTDGWRWVHPRDVTVSTILLVVAVGAVTGFLGGLFGKGGSALATPVLAAFGVPPIVAVASPLPATIPGTLIAARQYWRERHVDGRVLVWTAGVGLPLTVLGALLTRWIAPDHLVVATDLVVAGLGLSILVGARRHRATPPGDVAGPRADGDRTEAGEVLDEGREAVLVASRVASPAAPGRPGTLRLVVVAATVGLLAGLLANSGGFLLAPLFLVVLALPLRRALGTSLAASALLAIPGTVAHAALGHVDWALVAVFSTASVPLSALGARTALRVHPERLEVCFGALLVVAATLLLVWG